MASGELAVPLASNEPETVVPSVGVSSVIRVSADTGVAVCVGVELDVLGVSVGSTGAVVVGAELVVVSVAGSWATESFPLLLAQPARASVVSAAAARTDVRRSRVLFPSTGLFRMGPV
ncbi:hypothetical protein GCM10009798_31430 [Nocardioides panacihumi]|uniref:Uncharacterized protein n=1 Tax=Nocardioides panacihumi TaxID=400774 RepID=A0ABP5CUD2_9ACTN